MRTTSTTPAHRLLLALAILTTATGACSGNLAAPAAPSNPGPSGTPGPTASPPATESPAAPGVLVPTPVPAATPVRNIPRVSIPPAQGGDGDVPQDILDAVIADAAARTGAAIADITIATAKAVTWPDGALGCPRPGFMYTQMIEQGYQVIVETAGQRLDYRVGSSGTPSLCENPPGPS